MGKVLRAVTTVILAVVLLALGAGPVSAFNGAGAMACWSNCGIDGKTEN
jgi:hypothetical protein